MENRLRITLFLKCYARNDKINSGSKDAHDKTNVAGTSGAAPAEVLAKLGLDWLGFPEFRHWSVPDADKTRAKEYTFGDGGILENLRIMSLLMRKVERIVVFVNTKAQIKGGGKDEINDSIPPLFGKTPPFSLNHVSQRKCIRN